MLNALCKHVFVARKEGVIGTEDFAGLEGTAS